MLRSAMKKCNIREVKTYNGGKITATNGMTKESYKAQSRPTTQHVKAVYEDGHTEDIRKCAILKRAIEITHEENKAKVKDNLHKLVDKL
jgi:Zn/Cd-binding protein ZinT